MNPKTYPAFEKATGVKVKKDFYVSNEDLLAMEKDMKGRPEGVFSPPPPLPSPKLSAPLEQGVPPSAPASGVSTRRRACAR